MGVASLGWGDVVCVYSKFAVLEVLREDEFSPLKNAEGGGKNTPLTARLSLMDLHYRQLLAAGGTLVSKEGRKLPLMQRRYTAGHRGHVCSGHTYPDVCSGHTYPDVCSGHTYPDVCSGHTYPDVCSGHTYPDVCSGHTYPDVCSGHTYPDVCSGHTYPDVCSGHTYPDMGSQGYRWWVPSLWL